MTRSLSLLLVSAALVSTNGCGHYRPAVFADRPIVDILHDDQPISIPSQRTFDEREHISDIYLRRPLFDVIRPLDFATGGDVNALDEVPTSTWYDPQQGMAGASDAVSAPPTLPLFALDEAPVTHDDALVVRDAQGLRYELLGDPPNQLGLFTAAEVLGGYLLRGVGLRAPRAWIVPVPDAAVIGDGPGSKGRLGSWLARKAASVDGVRRVSATHWPVGIDVGVSGDYSARRDDPNDTVDHHDRRTLRATRVFAQWLGWSRFGVRSTRDVYVGRPGEGHLVHYLVGTSRAFGTQDLQAAAVRDEGAGSPWWHLITLGLSRPPPRPARLSPFPSLGYLPRTIDGSFDVDPPYSPFVRLTPSDEYWAAKRLIDAGDGPLLAGIAAAGLPVDAARYLAEVMRSRRRLLVAHGMTVVSPLDVTSTGEHSIRLRDRAISAGLAQADETQYDVAFLDVAGGERSPRIRVRASGALTEVALPSTIVDGLVILQVRAVRAGVGAPRPCDLHIVVDRASARVIGVRH